MERQKIFDSKKENDGQVHSNFADFLDDRWSVLISSEAGDGGIGIK